MSGTKFSGQTIPTLYMRSTLFWVGFLFSTILFALCSPVLLPLGFEARFRFFKQWSVFNVWWLGLTCGLRYRVTGREHLDCGPAILMPKHESTWETMALQRIIPPQAWVLKRELLRVPFFGWGMAMLHPIAIDRSAGRKAMAQLVRQGEDRLRRGIWVVVFPEGTRVAPGTTRDYKIGGVILAVRSGRPIVPIAHNAGDFWPRHSFVKRPGVIEVRIGPPIATAGRDAEAVLAEVREWIERNCAEIRGLRAKGVVFAQSSLLL